MRTKNLTKNEKDTLWGLVNHPQLNDKALAKKIHLKLSTVTAIRRRLRERGYFSTVNIPDLYRLGYEMLSVDYGEFNEATPLERRVKYFKEFVSKEPNAVFAVMSRANGVVFNIVNNYSEAATIRERMEIFFTSHHLVDEGSWGRAIFPFKTSKFWNFFSFPPVLRYVHFQKKKINVPEFSANKEAGQVSLSKKEKMVLFGLVKYPEEPDSNIAERFGVSRQGVSNIKKRFVSEGLLSTQRIMNFDHTGCELLVFAYTFFGPRAPLRMRKSGLEYTQSLAPAFVGVSSNFENILFAAIREYSEYEKMREQILSFYKSHMSLAKSPEILLFPVKDICYCKKPTFHEILENHFVIHEK
ncbi:MAG: hypothetical protein JSW28_04165 [Thermoplasmata archaeon]|nr:MAG: hypothetical protein JSW28_04165 [Thermoplasmata archaeon]